MDYELMHIKLEAARKEIRQNVPMLKYVDDFNAKFILDIFFGVGHQMLKPSKNGTVTAGQNAY